MQSSCNQNYFHPFLYFKVHPIQVKISSTGMFRMLSSFLVLCCCTIRHDSRLVGIMLQISIIILFQISHKILKIIFDPPNCYYYSTVYCQYLFNIYNSTIHDYTTSSLVTDDIFFYIGQCSNVYKLDSKYY